MTDETAIFETEGKMIQFRLKQLMADKEFREGRNITWEEMSAHVGLSRVTLGKIANSTGKVSIRSENIEKLCRYFGCEFSELMVIVPDGEDG